MWFRSKKKCISFSSNHCIHDIIFQNDLCLENIENDVEKREKLLTNVSVADVDGEKSMSDVDVVSDAIVAKTFRLSSLVQHVVGQVTDDL